jgi:hypothetical protein
MKDFAKAVVVVGASAAVFGLLYPMMDGSLSHVLGSVERTVPLAVAALLAARAL